MLLVALAAIGSLATTSWAFFASGPVVRPKWALPTVGHAAPKRRHLRKAGKARARHIGVFYSLAHAIQMLWVFTSCDARRWGIVQG